MATQKTVKGKVCNFNGGTYQLRVDYTVEKSNIKFRPYIVLSKSFNAAQTVQFWWNIRPSGIIEKGKKNEGDYKYKEKKQGPYKRRVKYDKTGKKHNGLKYFAALDSKSDTARKTITADKKYKNKKGKKVTKKVTISIDKQSGKTAGRWFHNYDAKITVYVKVGKDATQSITIDEFGKPDKPGTIQVTASGAAPDTNWFDVKLISIKSDVFKPIKTLRLERLTDSEVESGQSYSTIDTITYPGDGDKDGIKDRKFDRDFSVDDGHRYKYRVVATNLKGSSNSDTTAWYYTKPPELSSVAHARISDKINRVSITRDSRCISKEIIKGYKIQYTTDPITSLSPTWIDIDLADLRSSEINSDHTDWKPTTSTDEVYVEHIACKEDTTYRYRIQSSNRLNGGTTGTVLYSRNFSPGIDGTAITYNQPLKPDKVEGKLDTETGYVDLVIQRQQLKSTADKMFIQRQDETSSKYVLTEDTSASLLKEYYTLVGTAIENPSLRELDEYYEKTQDIFVKTEDTYIFPDKTYYKVTATLVLSPVDSELLTYYEFKRSSSEWVWVSSTDGVDISPVDTDNKIYNYKDESIIPQGNVRYRVSLGCTKSPIEEGPSVDPDGASLVIGNGRSEWLESPEIITYVKPNPPTLILPINDSYISDEQLSVRLAWIHSPKDGSQQSAAVIEYRKLGVDTWSTVNIIGAAAFYEMDTSTFNINDVIEWRVYTKGAARDFSDASLIKRFVVYGVPRITLLTPGNTEEINNLPINITWEYEDLSGTCAETQITVVDEDDDIVFSANAGTSGEYSLIDYLFDDETNYLLRLTAISTTGLSKTVEASIHIHYIPMAFTNGYTVSAFFDEDTGYAYPKIAKIDFSNTIAIDQATEEESAAIDATLDPDEDEDAKAIVSDYPVNKLYLYREYYGEKTLIESYDVDLVADAETEAYEILDKYAPINHDFNYILIQRSTIGEIGISYHPMNFTSLWWYIYWNDNNIARAKWNPTGQMSLSRPERQEVRYSGRTYPVMYDSSAINETYSFNTTIFEGIDGGWDDIMMFRQLMEDGGFGVWKSFEGDVYTANFDFGYSSDYTDDVRSWACSLNVSRIDEDA